MEDSSGYNLLITVYGRFFRLQFYSYFGLLTYHLLTYSLWRITYLGYNLLITVYGRLLQVTIACWLTYLSLWRITSGYNLLITSMDFFRLQFVDHSLWTYLLTCYRLLTICWSLLWRITSGYNLLIIVYGGLLHLQFVDHSAMRFFTICWS